MRERKKIVSSVVRGVAVGVTLAGISCSTIPQSNYKAYPFPKDSVFVNEKPSRRYRVLRPVRVRVNYPSLIPEHEDQELCQNAFNKGATDLQKRAAKEQKADAVIDVRAVVYFMDGKMKRYSTPECSDDGNEGQILMEGIAIRYLPDPKPSPKPKG